MTVLSYLRTGTGLPDGPFCGGRISSWLAVRFLGWPFGFFGRFLKVVWLKIFLLAVFENMSIF